MSLLYMKGSMDKVWISYKTWLIYLTLSSLVLLSVSAQAQAPLPAFPGAEGFGALATGGRGGRVIKVTNLNASGPGSLQDAVSQSGPRIVVFNVSGEIHGDITIKNGDLTIAGQTAPGAGITIRGRLYSQYRDGINNIIIRHIRVRPLMFEDFSGLGEEYDAIQFSKNRNFIFDHITASWGVDETVDLYKARDVTIQWSTIEESATFGHAKSDHNYGLLNGPDGSRISIHHNLFANHRSRCPAIASGPAEIINNVIYNVKNGFHHHNPADGQFNIIGNYYRRGPSSPLHPFPIDYSGKPGLVLSYYFEDNYLDDLDNFVGVVNNPLKMPDLRHRASLQKKLKGGLLSATRMHDFTKRRSGYIPVTTQKSKEILNLVLEKAGAFPRDVVTLRTIDEVRKRNGTWGVKEPDNLMEGLTPTSPPKDTDNDGMPDSWEAAHGLNPDNGNDHNQTMPSGYTAIEDYVNELSLNLTGKLPGYTIETVNHKAPKTKEITDKKPSPDKQKVEAKPLPSETVEVEPQPSKTVDGPLPSKIITPKTAIDNNTTSLVPERASPDRQKVEVESPPTKIIILKRTTRKKTTSLFVKVKKVVPAVVVIIILMFIVVYINSGRKKQKKNKDLW